MPSLSTTWLPAHWKDKKFGALIMGYGQEHTQAAVEAACLETISQLPDSLKAEMNGFVQVVNALWSTPDMWTWKAGAACDLISQKLSEEINGKNLTPTPDQCLCVFQIAVLNFALWTYTDPDLRAWIDQATNGRDIRLPEPERLVSIRAPVRSRTEFSRTRNNRHTPARSLIRQLSISLTGLAAVTLLAFVLIPWSGRDNPQVIQAEMARQLPSPPSPEVESTFPEPSLNPPAKDVSPTAASSVVEATTTPTSSASDNQTNDPGSEPVPVEAPGKPTTFTSSPPALDPPPLDSASASPPAAVERPHASSRLVTAAVSSRTQRRVTRIAPDWRLSELKVDGDLQLRSGDPARALGSYMVAAYLGNPDAGRNLQKMGESAPKVNIIDQTVSDVHDSCDVQLVSVSPFASTFNTLAMGFRLTPVDQKTEARIEHISADRGNAQLIVSRNIGKDHPVSLALIGVQRTANRLDIIAACGSRVTSINLSVAAFTAAQAGMADTRKNRLGNERSVLR